RIESSQLNQLSRKTEVWIPPEAVNEFYRHTFEDLIAAYDLRGEDLIGEPLNGLVPQPRVYLTEEGGELRVLLRFAYNGLDCIAVKNVPSHSYVYDPEREVVVTIERQAIVESEWRERLGKDEFGLKNGNLRGRVTPDVFVLRAKVHPFDFLK